MYCQAQTEIDRRFNALKESGNSGREVQLDSLMNYIGELDTASGNKLTKKLLAITARFNDPYCYIKTSAFSARFGSIHERTERIYQAYNLAKEYNKKNLIAYTLVILSEICQERNIFDSTMICVILAKDLFYELGDSYPLVTVLHKIGDLFYAANLLNEAEAYYKEVLQLKGNPFDWSDWRKFVIRNNFGLIERKRGNYYKAKNHFTTAVTYLPGKGKSFSAADSVRITYSYLNLAENAIDLNNLDSAKIFLEKVFLLNSKLNWPKYWRSYYLLCGRLKYLEEDYPLSIQLLEKSKSTDANYNYSDFYAQVFKYLSESYEKSEDIPKALENYKLYDRFVDSLASRRNIKAAIYLLMNDKLKKSEAEVDFYQNRQLLLFGAIIAIFLFVTILLFFYFNMSEAYRNLVFKNLEVTELGKKQDDGKDERDGFNSASAPDKESESPEPAVVLNGHQNNGNKAKMNSFLHKLESEMNEKEVYKKTYLTLDNLAHDLGTNRTFLSKLIHTHYGVPFNTYINNLRITKAIEIMKHNEDVGDIDKIDTIYKAVGFSNRTTFISAFKDYTGLTPSVFMKKLHQLN